VRSISKSKLAPPGLAAPGARSVLVAPSAAPSSSLPSAPARAAAQPLPASAPRLSVVQRLSATLRLSAARLAAARQPMPSALPSACGAARPLAARTRATVAPAVEGTLRSGTAFRALFGGADALLLRTLLAGALAAQRLSSQEPPLPALLSLSVRPPVAASLRFADGDLLGAEVAGDALRSARLRSDIFNKTFQRKFRRWYFVGLVFHLSSK